MNSDSILSIKDATGRHLSLLNEPNHSHKIISPIPKNGMRRKYHCAFSGCYKSFTTSGHLARHNRIHTGEKNFGCLHPGCLSRFSRQDNMMQHYRTHISPRSRRYQRASPTQPLHQSNPPLEWISSRHQPSLQIHIHNPNDNSNHINNIPRQLSGKLVKIVKPQPIKPVVYDYKPQRLHSNHSVCSSASSASFPLSPPIPHHSSSFQNTKINHLDLPPSRHMSYSQIVNTIG
ncbi:hypothetical protein J3Q64DRAFT_1763394 [Phycomyces blakesleeanus]|uniref:C2H2-type domain-containing protein n=2 Tax=Phycomyces blakesleeanus TaxID=4837 RepID=A0ABR3AQB6_PHYBL